MGPCVVVWFKRDLRVTDHRPLVEGCASGRPVVCLYIVEPSVTHASDFDPIHARFIQESLVDLNRELISRGNRLVIRRGEALEVLADLHRTAPIAAIYSHEETGNALTYARDRAVLAWCRANRIPWHETPSNGVVRRLASRNGWARTWEQRMAEPIAPAPANIPSDSRLTILTSSQPCFESPVTARQVEQRGGATRAQHTLQDFLTDRGIKYSGGLSSPVSAFTACSRLSAYLAYGNLSTREVVAATRQRVAQLDPEAPNSRAWRRSLQSFDQRLHWRCHFMQKLESEPAIETNNFVRALDGLREEAFNQDYFDAWCAGRTGFPMVDACMRALLTTGWLNFRMRAMLASVAAYQLWLHWKPTAVFTARAWLDYEPGIHYSQFQMQSGTTGINTLRLYNPTKQGQDHDPEGIFIRRWLPELAGVPTRWIHTPWLMPAQEQASLGVRVGTSGGYPAPIVDHLKSIALAKSRITEFRKAHPDYWEQVREVNAKHGSRRKLPSKRTSKPSDKPSPKPSSGSKLAAGKKSPGMQRSLFDDD